VAELRPGVQDAVAPAVATRVLASWPDLGEPRAIVRNGMSANSLACLVECAGGRFALKGTRPGRKAAGWLTREHEAMRVAAAAGLPVPAPLASAAGTTVVAQDGVEWAVYPEAAGVDRYGEASVFAPFDTDAEAFSAGAMLARLHLALADLAWPARPFVGPVAQCDLAFSPDLHRDFRELCRAAAGGTPALPGQAGGLPGAGGTADSAARMAQRLSAAGTEACATDTAGGAGLRAGRDAGEKSCKRRQEVLGAGEGIPGLAGELPGVTEALRMFDALRPGTAAILPAPRVIHGDWIKRNLFFAGDQVAAILDFDLCNRGYRVFDLALAVSALAYPWPLLAGGGAPHAAQGERLVEGYESVRPLDAAERALLPALLPVCRFEYHLSLALSALAAGDPAQARWFWEGQIASLRWWYDRRANA